jgi:hypothetical protein
VTIEVVLFARDPALSGQNSKRDYPRIAAYTISPSRRGEAHQGSRFRTPRSEPRVLSSCHPQRTGSNNLRNSPLFAGVFLACRPNQPGSGHFVGENLILTQTRW